MVILVSACLLGINCRYDGSGQLKDTLLDLMKYHTLIPVCPEQLGGMSTPREPSERIRDRVENKLGIDVTKAFYQGAEEVVKLAELYQCSYAVLKERSPSCGSDGIYDGTFSGRVVPGQGVAAEMLRYHGIKVIGESMVLSFLEELI